MIVLANILQPLIDVANTVLVFFHDQAGLGWGMSIIALTVAVRLAILPLTFKGVKGMQELQRLQPEIKRIQERYKDDRQRMQQETMRFYQEHKVNPLSSCMPLLLQIPFFISLFYLLRGDEFKREIRGEERFLFITDLAEKEAGLALAALIVLYVVTQLGASVVTAISADKNQRMLMLALPFVFVFFIFAFPAGLLVYWITTNVWTVGQQLLVRKLYPKPDPIDISDEPAPKARGKPATAGAGGGRDGSGASVAEPEQKRSPFAALREFVEGGPSASPGTGVSSAKARTPSKSGGDGQSNGGNSGGARAPRGGPPPPSPRKKKKRSGRRR